MFTDPTTGLQQELHYITL